MGKLLAIGIGDGPETMHRALELAHAHPEIWATAGIHPQEAHQATAENLAKLAALVATRAAWPSARLGSTTIISTTRTSLRSRRRSSRR